LDREAAETLDPREDVTSSVRSRLLTILYDRMRGVDQQGAKLNADLPPPPGEQPGQQQQQPNGPGPQLPPLTFEPSPQQERPSLTPITERSGTQSRSPTSDQNAAPLPSIGSSLQSNEDQRPTENILNRPFTSSPGPGPGPEVNDSNGTTPVQNDGSSNFTASQSDQQLATHGGFGADNTQMHNPTNLPPSVAPSNNFSSPIHPPSSPSATIIPSSNNTTPTKSANSNRAPVYSLSDPPVNREPSTSSTPFPTSPSPPNEDSLNLSSEAGALYYMMQQNEPGDTPRRVPTTISERDEGTSETGAGTTDAYGGMVTAEPLPQTTATPNGFPFPDTGRASPAAGSGLGRKPTGARGPGIETRQRAPGSEPLPVSGENSDDESNRDPPSTSPSRWQPETPDDPDLDALAALSYLDSAEPIAEAPAQAEPPQAEQRVEEAPQVVPPPPESSESHYKSSFAPSKQAEERKARSQAQQAAHNAAVSKPGRSNGKRKMKNGDGGAWNDSSEEDEEDEEDDDVDSDPEPPTATTSQNPAPGSMVQNGQGKLPQAQGQPLLTGGPGELSINPPSRPIRHLPQIPSGRSPGTIRNLFKT
jgi:CCR4-NOT transcriptional complex subunit CAF120